MQMLEVKATPTAPFELFPGRICILSAKHKAPEGGQPHSWVCFGQGMLKIGSFERIKAREMG